MSRLPTIKLRVVVADGDSFRADDVAVPLNKIMMAYQNLNDKWTTLLLDEGPDFTEKYAVMEFPETIFDQMKSVIKEHIKNNPAFYKKKSRCLLPAFYDFGDGVAMFYMNNIDLCYEIAKRHTRVVFRNGYSISVNGYPSQIKSSASKVFQEFQQYKETL